MAPSRTPQPPVHLASARMLDATGDRLVEPGSLIVEGGRITEVSPSSVPTGVATIDLGEVTMLPGLMDMEVNLVMGGPNHASPLVPRPGGPGDEDPPWRGQRPADPAGRDSPPSATSGCSCRPVGCSSTSPS